MKFVVISGSHRKESQSLKVSSWLAQNLESRDRDFETDIIDLGGNSIPLWDQSAWDPNSALSAQMKPYLERVEQADVFIIVAPEWNGTAPGGLKNVLHYIGSQHSGHKPAMLVGVSGGRGGTYPIAELHMSGFKNNRIVPVPDHLIVQDVEKVMNDPLLHEGTEDDQYIKKRAAWSLDNLIAYAAAFKTMRGSRDLLHKDYPFGM